MPIYQPNRNVLVELESPPDGRLNCGAIYYRSEGGEDLSAQDILDGVSDALLILWPHHPLVPPDEGMT